MIDLREFFSRAVVINLDHRADRMSSFILRMGVAGIRGVERFRAIDGVKCPPPPWFRSGPGAWGCLQSHLRVFQDALHDDLESVLIFEDDVIFRENFAEGVQGIAGHIQHEQWSSLYFGGYHLENPVGLPRPYAPGIIRSFNINRTHAYAVHRRMFPTIVRSLLDASAYSAGIKASLRPNEREFTPHLDHLLGKIHEQKSHLILAAQPWLCGQASGHSNILDRPVMECYWDSEHE